MRLNFPKNTEKYYWTEHAKYKMQYYSLSAQKILGVVRRPKRKEEGIVKNTIAVMQPVSPKLINRKEIWKQEIWVMYQLRYHGAISKSQFPTLPTGRQVSKKIRNSKFEIRNSANRLIRIISAWRYPGISPKKNPIPEKIINELLDLK
ncbi:MAG TPA: hypothetical protein P5262_02825 [Candidatus Moranbacteria bacterium]|nr:hypothetical protein [Candidatus Moranbacteria bacterium]